MGRRRAKRARTQGHRDDHDEPTSSGRRARACRGDWTNLTAGPAGQIADLLLSHSVADYLRFRAVCAAWRACTDDDPRAHGVLDSRGWRFQPRRWIMLPLPFHFGSRRPFLDISTGETFHVRIPDLYDRHHLFASTSEGLIVMSRQDTLAAVHLLNPLTGQRSADLPRVTALLENYKGSAPRRRLKDFGVGSAGLAGDSMVALDYGFGSGIAVARPGDKFWTRLKVNGTFKSATSFGGRFYCVTSRNILVVETTANRRPQLAVAVDFGPGNAFPDWEEVQLVDNGGELILVQLAKHGYTDMFPYKTYRVRLDTRSIEPMHGLCGRALFMGTSRSLSMSATVSRSTSEDTVYKCYDYDKVSGRPNWVVAIDLLGRCFMPQFHKNKDDVAHYVSCYVSS